MPQKMTVKSSFFLMAEITGHWKYPKQKEVTLDLTLTF